MDAPVFSKSAKISVPTFDGLQMLNTDDIVKCVAHENYTEIILASGTRFMVSRLLKEYELMLSCLNFFRIHHSCLINLRHVHKYIKGEGGYVLMSDGHSCEVSRRKKQASWSACQSLNYKPEGLKKIRLHPKWVKPDRSGNYQLNSSRLAP